jgi:mitochondrial fission protein ELM1
MTLSTSDQWLVLEDGRAGTDGQALGLAEALKISFDFQSLNLSWLERQLPPLSLANYLSQKLFGAVENRPAGIIGAGRRASYGLLAASRRWPGITTIQIQDPRVDPKHFSYVIAPEHDALIGENVIPTLGGLHRINHARLQEAEKWAPQLSQYQRPRVAVLIGGNNKYVRLHPDWVDDVIAKCYALLDQGMSLWITVSRRTPQALRERLRAAFPHKSNVWFYAGTGDNPYLGFIGHADYFLVTADSVSMISEALYTDKPVALLRMPGEGKKFTWFYDSLFESGLTHWYDGDWKIKARKQLCETERVAELLRTKLKLA